MPRLVSQTAELMLHCDRIISHGDDGTVARALSLIRSLHGLSPEDPRALLELLTQVVPAEETHLRPCEDWAHLVRYTWSFGRLPQGECRPCRDCMLVLTRPLPSWVERYAEGRLHLVATRGFWFVAPRNFF